MVSAMTPVVRVRVSFGTRPAPPSLRPTRLDALQVDVLRALIETLPPHGGERAMSDIVDFAATIADEHVARGLSAIVRELPPGVAGECAACGETMPRLIGGRCGFCRDGRVPPPGFYDRPANSGAPRSTMKECVVMPASSTEPTRKISFTGAALAAIERRAAIGDLTYTEAAAQLIVAGAGAGAGSPVGPAMADATDPIDSAIGVLPELPDSALIEELQRRLMGQGVATAEHQAMADRAEAAEARLETLKSVLNGSQG